MCTCILIRTACHTHTHTHMPAVHPLYKDCDAVLAAERQLVKISVQVHMH